ncbi:hypothetical protein GCK72_010998 [Caenorhabditis remanei]|uniref:Uncharacterized protein n=1 Tax=Caenorhabditis remanei TaxID=31234 RepID=A0A6A5H797_CAERE|nr:hypothetical protein GCK72_010998 [Caenorhabditis remanei]KAF1762736.1 hypothetical protein GCK72_010998 [Caenorhabditis remanei]
MISTAPTKKYQSSKMSKIYIDWRSEEGDVRCLSSVYMIGTPERGGMIPNNHYDRSISTRSLFMLDGNDLEWLGTVTNKRLRKTAVGSLTAFMKIRPEKRIYIRYFPLVQDRVEKKRVVTDEVLEIIPLVLKQQKTPISGNDKRLKEYRRKWKVGEKEGECGRTIDMEELEDVLEEFDVNKELLTLVNDTFFTAYAKDHKSVGTNVIYFASFSMDEVVFSCHAALHIFQSLVSNINWKLLLTSSDNKKNVKSLKEDILTHISTFVNMNPGSLVRLDHVRKIMLKLGLLKNRFNILKDPAADGEFKEKKYGDVISTSCFYREIARFGLRDFGFNPKPLDDDIMEVSFARINIMLGWLDYFLDGEDMVEMKSMMMDAMTYKMKKRHRAEFFNVLNSAPPSPSHPKYTKSKLRETQMSMETVGTRPNGVYIGVTKDCIAIEPNLSMTPRKNWEKRNMKLFILDGEDISSMRNGQWEDARLDSLTQFMIHKPDKHIYIRTLKTVLDGKEVKRVQSKDVLEIIPLVLKQQKCPIYDIDLRLKVYKEMWKPVEHKKSLLHQTIDIEEFERVLEEFDINKSLITMVNDVSSEMTALALHKDGTTPISFLSHDGQQVMFLGQAVLYLFHILISGINWYLDTTDGEYKKLVRSVMRQYSEMGRNLLIPMQLLLSEITSLLKHCPPVLKQRPSVGVADFKLKNIGPMEKVDVKHYNIICGCFNLPYSLNTSEDRTKKSLCHIARQYFSIGFIHTFFCCKDIEIKYILRDAMMWKSPKESWCLLYQIMNSAFLYNHAETKELSTKLLELEVKSDIKDIDSEKTKEETSVTTTTSAMSMKPPASECSGKSNLLKPVSFEPYKSFPEKSRISLKDGQAPIAVSLSPDGYVKIKSFGTNDEMKNFWGGLGVDGLTDELGETGHFIGFKDMKLVRGDSSQSTSEKMTAGTATRQQLLKERKAAKHGKTAQAAKIPKVFKHQEEPKNIQSSSEILDAPGVNLNKFVDKPYRKLKKSKATNVQENGVQTDITYVKMLVKNMENHGMTIGKIELVDDLEGEIYGTESLFESYLDECNQRRIYNEGSVTKK